MSTNEEIGHLAAGLPNLEHEEMLPADTQQRIGYIGARLDRLPITRITWRLTLISQAFWGILLLIDPLAIRIYPYVWAPQHAFNSLQYSVLVGFENGGGVLIGEYLLTFLADRYGRKPLMIVSCILAGGLIWPIALTSNWVLLMVFVTLAAVGVGGALGLSSVYMSELVPAAERSRTMLGSQVLAAAIAALVGGIPPIFLLPDHVQAYVFLFAALPIVVMIPLLAFGIPESPRWLEAHGHHDRADAIMTNLEDKIQRIVGTLPPVTKRYNVVAYHRVPVKEIFRGVYLRRTLLLIAFWVLGYAGLDYGLGAFQVVYLAGDGHYNAQSAFLIIFLGSLVGLVGGTAVGALIGERVERTWLIFAAGVMSFLGALGYFFAIQNVVIAVISTILATGAVLVWAFNGYNYTAVAFPTRLRAIGTGWTDGIGHIGAVVGPIIASTLFVVSASSNHIAWFIWFSIVGGLLPCTLLLVFGMRQRQVVLEEASA